MRKIREVLRLNFDARLSIRKINASTKIVSLRRDSVTWQVELFRMALTQSMTELSLDFVGSSKGGNAQDF
ncbi:hypothetical protein, partial [Thalassotalea sp. ND16A]|uniref:hypothetical protein n=1 Tax=Thalassotalea sp. ND16A TaxID=1535422 RepID=UPI00051DC2BC